MRLVQPAEWYEKTIQDLKGIIEECGAGNPEHIEHIVQCIHCEVDIELAGNEGIVESPICNECWEAMWEEREKENKKVEDNYYNYSLIMKGIRNEPRL